MSNATFEFAGYVCWMERVKEQGGEAEKIKAGLLGTIECEARFGQFPCSLFSDTEDPEMNGDVSNTRASSTANFRVSTPLVSVFAGYGVLDVHPERRIPARTRDSEHEIQLSK
jgi:hypothetical protein